MFSSTRNLGFRAFQQRLVVKNAVIKVKGGPTLLSHLKGSSFHSKAEQSVLRLGASSSWQVIASAGLVASVATLYVQPWKDGSAASSTSVGLSPQDIEALPGFSMEQVAKHNSADSAWIVIDGVVYDVTSLLGHHPGGRGILLSFAGQDTTEQFYAMRHSERARAIQPGLAVGRVIGTTNQQVSKQTPNDVAAVDSAAKKKKKKRVVIVGGGICGTSAAYFLSQEPKVQSDWQIQVLENGPLVGGTALASSAIMWLGPLLEKHDGAKGVLSKRDAQGKQGGLEESEESSDVDAEDVIPKMSLTQWLGEEAYSFFKLIQSDWDDVEFTDKGTVGLVETDEQLEVAEAIFGAKGPVKGAQVVTDKEAMKVIEPGISPEQVKAIVYHERGATVDPYLVCDAFAKRARINGVDILYNHSVENLKTRVNSSGDEEYVIHCSNGAEVVADVLVLCTGYRVKTHAAQLGYEVPVKPMHGQMFAISGDNIKLTNNIYGLEGVSYWRKNKMKHQATRESSPPFNRITNHLYGVQLSNGVLKFGGDRVQADLNGVVLEDGIEANYETVTRLFPKLKGEPILGSWGGTMPFTPDQKIICGPLRDEENANLFVLTGSGFMRGLASGKLLAESIKLNQLSEVPVSKIHKHYLEQCSPLRFERAAAAKKQAVDEAAKEKKNENEGQ